MFMEGICDKRTLQIIQVVEIVRLNTKFTTKKETHMAVYSMMSASSICMHLKRLNFLLTSPYNEKKIKQKA